VQVLVTVAPDAGGDTGPDGAGEYALGQWDAHALEAAVRLRERHDGIEVVTVTVGSPAAEPVVRAALSKGADRAIRVWDDALDEADLFDPRLTTRLLAAIAGDVGPALVLTGAQSGPEGFGATGVTLAARLEYGWATVVTDISLDSNAGVVSVRCDRDAGRTDLLDVALPAVLTVGAGCNEPRHAGLGAVRAAQRAEIAVLSLADLGLDPADSGPSLRRVATADRDRDVTLFEGSPEDGAAAIARVLQAHGVDP
jgi:electron transfer flavoprotein beta subunit